MAHFTENQMRTIIQQYEFRTQNKFNSDPVCLNFLISYLANLKISFQSFLLIEKLIKFYKLPILICLQPFYSYLTEGYIEVYNKELKNITLLAQQLMGEYEFAQLSFLQKAGKIAQTQISNCNKKWKKLTPQDANFMAYANKISIIVNKALNLSKMAQSMRKDHRNLLLNLQHIEKEQKKYDNQMSKALQQNNFEYTGTMFLENNYIQNLIKNFEVYTAIITEICTSAEKNNKSFSIESKNTSDLISTQTESSLFNSAFVSIKEETNIIGNFYENCEQTALSNKEIKPEDIVKVYKQENNHIRTINLKQVDYEIKQLQSPVAKHQTNSISIDNKKFQLILPLCCRKSFTEGQPIIESNKEIYSFHRIGDIYSKQLAKALKQDICSMLNNKGGCIFVGINQKAQNKVYIVEGISLTEQEKEDILTYFRHLSQEIQTDIIYSRLYEVHYIPIKQRASVFQKQEQQLKKQAASKKNLTNKFFIPGLNVIRIKVKWGQRQQVYSYQHQNEDYFSFRNQEGIYYLQGRNLLKIIKSRFEEQIPVPALTHEGICELPDRGSPLYEKGLITKKIDLLQVKSRELDMNVYQKSKARNLKDFRNINQNKSSQGSKITVFGMAYDFLIFGLTQKKIEEIFQKQNHLNKVKISSLDENIVYLRNLRAQFLRSTKQILKNLYTHLDYKYQRYRVIAISRNIIIRQRDIELCYQLLYKNGIQNFESIDGREYHMLRFLKTWQASIIYLLLRDNGVECEFTLAPNQ